MTDQYQLPAHIQAGIVLTERHIKADRAIAYAIGALEAAIPLMSECPARKIMQAVLKPLRDYENTAQPDQEEK